LSLPKKCLDMKNSLVIISAPPTKEFNIKRPNERLFLRYPKTSILVFVLGFFCFSVLGLEFAYRVVQFVRIGRPLLYSGVPQRVDDNAYKVIQPDAELGWIIMPNVKMTKTMRDFEGNSYNLNFSTDSFGFRLRDNRPNGILFVGDSFTQAVDTSDGYTYYSEVKKLLPQLPVSGIGVVAYGTLQEVMLVDRIFSLVKPSAIVFQMCDNDLIDNSFELLCRAPGYPLYYRRPYWENDEVKYHERYGLRLATKSRLFWRLYDFFLYRWYSHTGPFIYKSNNDIGSILDEACEVTTDLLQRERTRRPGIKFFAFSLEDRSSSNRAPELLEKAATSAGYVWLGNLSQEVDRILGKKALARDGVHLNELGNTLVGELLAERLQGHLENSKREQ
jgi:hypothetical protein